MVVPFYQNLLEEDRSLFELFNVTDGDMCIAGVGSDPAESRLRLPCNRTTHRKEAES